MQEHGSGGTSIKKEQPQVNGPAIVLWFPSNFGVNGPLKNWLREGMTLSALVYCKTSQYEIVFHFFPNTITLIIFDQWCL